VLVHTNVTTALIAPSRQTVSKGSSIMKFVTKEIHAYLARIMHDGDQFAGGVDGRTGSFGRE